MFIYWNKTATKYGIMVSDKWRTKCPTVLLKADTGAAMNLMNSMTFDSLFDGNRKVLDPTSLKMEA